MTRPFTTEDFVRRLERATRQAADADLTGVLVTPGPDLLYLTGYARSPSPSASRCLSCLPRASRP